eukprot:7689666-Pyramimonas_sp.AAC.1
MAGGIGRVRNLISYLKLGSVESGVRGCDARAGGVSGRGCRPRLVRAVASSPRLDSLQGLLGAHKDLLCVCLAAGGPTTGAR